MLAPSVNLKQKYWTKVVVMTLMICGGQNINQIYIRKRAILHF